MLSLPIKCYFHEGKINQKSLLQMQQALGKLI
jgi:hypothetical protein